MHGTKSQVIWQPTNYNPKNGELTIIKGHYTCYPTQPIKEIKAQLHAIGLNLRIEFINQKWQVVDKDANIVAFLEYNKPVTLLVSYLSEEWR